MAAEAVVMASRSSVVRPLKVGIRYMSMSPPHNHAEGSGSKGFLLPERSTSF